MIKCTIRILGLYSVFTLLWDFLQTSNKSSADNAGMFGVCLNRNAEHYCSSVKVVACKTFLLSQATW